MRFLALLLCLASIVPAIGAEGDVPEAIQGRWVGNDQACTAAMVLSATTIVYPDGTIDDVIFSADENVFRIQEEATAYEYVAADDRLLFRPEGFGMGSAFPMLRCPDRTSILERRCGWLANISAGNWSLIDADRTWILFRNGDESGDTIPIMDMVPAFDPEQYVATDEYHGYGCACMTVTTDQDRITAIASTQRLPLATCQSDANLPALADW